jgi:Rad3-related DNA helicase
LRQTVDMSDSESKAFIDSFTVDSRITGFAVIGGKFSEGIDLKGLRLRGAVIVSLGLAPRSIRYDDLALRLAEGVPGSDNDALAAMDSYDYAYRFPALQRVIQTAGRVVRSEHDRGVVILVDPRFCQSRNLDLLPEHWAPQVVSNAQEITEALNSFWQNPKQEELDGLERA